MPIYEYQCTECEKIFEEFSKINNHDEIYPICPDCGAATKRVFRSPNAVNTAPWKEMQELMRKDARGEIDIPEKDYPYDYKRNKGLI